MVSEMHEAERAGEHGYAIEIMNRLTNGHLGTVIGCAQGLSIRYGEDIWNLMSEGWVALLRNVKEYNLSNPKRASLRSCASSRINQAMRKYMMSNSVIRMPVYLTLTYEKIREIQKKMPGADLDDVFAAVKKSMGCPINQVRNAYNSCHQSRGIVSIAKAHNKSGEIDENDLNTTLQEAMRPLSFRERQTLISHYGLGNEEMTFQEIGEIFHTSRQRIKQIETKALKKLRSLVKELL
jgi:RNA polymerase primary sigma factor